MFAKKPPQSLSKPPPTSASTSLLTAHDDAGLSPAELIDYASDYSDASEEEDDLVEDISATGKEDGEAVTDPVTNSNGKRNLLPTKLDVPWRTVQKEKKAEKLKVLTKAFEDLHKLIHSPKTKFTGGPNGLQSYRARAIRSNLQMQAKQGLRSIAASHHAALSHGFSANNGGRNVRRWTRDWVQSRCLPCSRRGCHSKVYSLLDDPAIKTELRAYVRSRKWCMDPQKLAQFTLGELIPKEATQYLQKIVKDEMPRGLKRYMEIELFPRIQLKMTAQANDAQVKRWVFQNQHMLRKKGVGRGIHQSDVICSTVGWLKGASQSMEYGKNYEGYWNGEMFVKQLKEKIIPVFEEVHGPGYQALIMVDNSQGHSAYAEDALLTSRMNVGSGGKQARLRNGWYLNSGGTRVSQSMVFPESHPEYPNQPKGIKQILSERVKRYLREHCDYTFTTLQENMPKALESVAVATIRRWEHRMQRWMEAYRQGMDAQSAQLHVRQFSSRKYTSHRRIPEAVARAFD
ncbi:hypothetical protein C8J55DRAFT_536848 [Lentinula edodes]|uniref:DDE-1 domain-containing protein n=2 Tax=Lentinula lateritia TaxID=40482 RepID=A0A9W9A5X0_9AGAR|nr:hypothetical protein C8J55DRAFT_536848 [Lentinula edodes]